MPPEQSVPRSVTPAPLAPSGLTRDSTPAGPRLGARALPTPQEMGMGFFDHFEELRQRLVRCAWWFVIGFALSYWVSEPLMDFLRRPLFAVLPPEQHKLYFTAVFENFLVHLKISAYASVFLFSPLYFWEIWRFVAPGLHAHERRLVLPFVGAATGCFLAGAGFAYAVVFPAAFRFFVNYGGPTEVPWLTLDAYYSTALKLLLVFGLAFELPVLLTLLGWLGVLSAPLLRAQRRSAIIAITVASALFAPPDAVSMLMLMAPLILLYEAAIVAIAAIERRRAAGAVAPP